MNPRTSNPRSKWRWIFLGSLAPTSRGVIVKSSSMARINSVFLVIVISEKWQRFDTLQIPPKADDDVFTATEDKYKSRFVHPQHSSHCHEMIQRKHQRFENLSYNFCVQRTKMCLCFIICSQLICLGPTHLVLMSVQDDKMLHNSFRLLWVSCYAAQCSIFSKKGSFGCEISFLEFCSESFRTPLDPFRPL